MSGERLEGASSNLSSATSETFKIPSRRYMIEDMKRNNQCDILVIGGGATGAGNLLKMSRFRQIIEVFLQVLLSTLRQEV